MFRFINYTLIFIPEKAGIYLLLLYWFIDYSSLRVKNSKGNFCSAAICLVLFSYCPFDSFFNLLFRELQQLAVSVVYKENSLLAKTYF